MNLKIVDWVIEGLFLLDFIFCFCQVYKDEETYTLVTDIKKIAIHYIRGSCFFDLIAIIPFAQLVTINSPAQSDSKIRLFRLLKLLRIPRLVQLLDVERFKSVITDYFNKRL